MLRKLRKNKLFIIFIITFAIVVIGCLAGLIPYAEASISDYITNVKFYQSGIYAKLKFDVIQDFKIAWNKQSDRIYLVFGEPTQILVEHSFVDGAGGNGGMMLTKDELNNIPEGLYERWFYGGNTYDTYVMYWGCSYDGCIDPDEFVVFVEGGGCSSDDYIRLRLRQAGENTLTVYCAGPPHLETPVKGPTDGPAEDAINHLNGSRTNLVGLIALIIGLSAGVWIIYRIIKSRRLRRKE